MPRMPSIGWMTGASPLPSRWLTTPPQAAAAGFNTLAFFDDFTSAATVTGNASFTTHQAGINWYPGEGKTLVDPTHYHMLTSTTAAGISNGNSGGGVNASPNGGIIQITGISTITNQGDFISVPNALTQTPGSIGGFGPTGYWEGYMQFLSTDTAHVSFWTLPLALATSTLTELDIVEANIGGVQADLSIGNLNQWTANFGSDVTFTSINATIAKDSNWHTYGMLVVATTGGQGTMTAYLDNVAVGNITVGTSTSYTNVFSDPSGAVTRYWIMGKDTGANVVNFDWVKYWSP